MSARRILVADRATALACQVRAALPDDSVEVVPLRQVSRLVDVVAEQGPWDVVVAGPSQETPPGLRRLAALRSRCADVGLVVAVNGHQPADLRSFVHARPDDMVHLPAANRQLAATLEATLAKVAVRRARIQAERVRVAPPPPPPQARMLVVVGPTGGSGKTTLATNLATLLARGQRRVVLADLDLQFGEVSAALQLQPASTLYDVLFDEQDRPLDDAAVVEAVPSCLVDAPGGYKVLAAPRDPAQADAIGAAELARLLPALAGCCDEVVIDAPAGLREVTLAALDHAAHAVIVCQVDVPGLYNLRAFLETLDRLELPAARRSIVLNKELAEAGLAAADAAKLVGPVTGSVPFSGALARSTNVGQPLCLAAPDDPAALAVARALGHLLPSGDEATPTEAGRTARLRWPAWRRPR